MTTLRSILLSIPIMAMISCGGATGDRHIGTEVVEMPDEDRVPGIAFADTLYDTGRIAQGELVHTSFDFVNDGNAPLVIASVSGSCGCTVPRSYPKGKIMPGEGGTIEVNFDSSNKWGKQTVVVSVVTNTVPSRTELLIMTDIAVPDNMKTK